MSTGQDKKNQGAASVRKIHAWLPTRVFRRVWAGPERKRLAAELTVERAKLARMRASATKDEPWAETADGLLMNCEDQARDGDLDAGWKFLHGARQEMVKGMTSDELDAEIVVVSSEAEAKLSSWRKTAAGALLSGPHDGSPIEKRRTDLSAALRTRDEHSENVYFRNRLIRRQMLTVAICMFVLVSAFLTTIRCSLGLPTVPSTHEFMRLDVLVAAMSLGGIGACLSALITFASSTPEIRIPEHLANVAVTLTRPLIGSISGLVAMLLLQAGVVEFGGVSLLVPLAFGFSERLVVGALGSLGTNGK